MGKKRKRIVNFAVDIKCIKIIKRLWKNIWIIFCCKTRGVMLGMDPRVFVANWFMFYVSQLGKHQGNLRSLINIFTMSYHYSGHFILAAEKKNEIQSKEPNANAISQSPLHLKSNIPLSDNNRSRDITSEAHIDWLAMVSLPRHEGQSDCWC